MKILHDDGAKISFSQKKRQKKNDAPFFVSSFFTFGNESERPRERNKVHLFFYYTVTEALWEIREGEGGVSLPSLFARLPTRAKDNSARWSTKLFPAFISSKNESAQLATNLSQQYRDLRKDFLMFKLRSGSNQLKNFFSFTLVVSYELECSLS